MLFSVANLFSEADYVAMTVVKDEGAEESQRVALVITTCADPESANALAEILLNSKCAACVSVVNSVKSKYTWESKRECSEEVLLLIKTSIERLGDLRKCILEYHAYDAPEILHIDAASLSPAYNTWLKMVTS